MTEKETLFCKEYLIDFNAKNAAIRAGYSKNSARVIGCQNLTKLNILAEINKEIDKRNERIAVKQDRIIYELAKIAFSDLSNFIDINGDTITIRDLTDIDTSVLSEASETVTKDGGTIKIKLADKMKALELLGKHLAMFTDKLEHSGSIDIPPAQIKIDGKPIANSDS